MIRRRGRQQAERTPINFATVYNTSPVKIDADNMLITSNVGDQFTPFHSLFFSEYKKAGDLRYLVYGLNNTVVLTWETTLNLRSVLLDYVGFCSFKLTHGDITTDYRAAKHLIFTTDEAFNIEILMCLVVETEYMLETNYFGGRVSPLSEHDLDRSKFRLLVSTQLLYNSRHSKLKTYFEKNLFKFYANWGIDVIWTNDIRKYAFKDKTIINPNGGIRSMSLQRQHFETVNEEVINEFIR